MSSIEARRPSAAIATTGPITGGKGQANPAVPSLPPNYVEHEYFFGGTATSFRHVGEVTADGCWAVEPAATAPYLTRLIVRRPSVAEEFSGVVVLEWLNVTAGADGSPEWGYANEEITREGHVWVGVSAQKVGVAGGTAAIGEAAALTGASPGGLVAADPERYGTLIHPGDAFCFDIFSQAAEALKASEGPPLLGGLQPLHLIAIGESQSATFLATYFNAVHPLAQVFDGFLLHSRVGSSPSVGGEPLALDGPPVTLRTDLEVPVLQFVTETDLTVLRFEGARQPDHDLLRTWEVAGTAHADKYLICQMMGGLDFEPADFLGSPLPVNDGPHHETFKAALHHLVDWVVIGTPPPGGPRIESLPPSEIGGAATIARDELGIALGGIRTPPVDVPVVALSGDPAPGASLLSALFGTTRRFDAATLARLYPTNEAYLEAYSRAMVATVKAGFILPIEADEMLALAEAKGARG